MRRVIALRWARNPWLAALLLGAIFTRALIPVGYMPSAGGVMLCPGYTFGAAGLGTDSVHHDDMAAMGMSDHGMVHGGMVHGGRTPAHDIMCICPFSAAATALGLSNEPALAQYAPVVQTDITFKPQRFVPRDTVVPTRLPRGPPPSLI